jgi:hypothetical protein
MRNSYYRDMAESERESFLLKEREREELPYKLRLAKLVETSPQWRMPYWRQMRGDKMEGETNETAIEYVQAAIDIGCWCCLTCLDIVTGTYYYSRPRCSVLCTAASQGHAACVQCLLKAGHVVDYSGGGSYFTPLQCAIEGGYDSVVQMLILAGADVALVNRVQCVSVPQWVDDLSFGRHCCLCAVIAFLGVRRFNRSSILCNPYANRDIVEIIARIMWHSRGHKAWDRKISVAGNSKVSHAQVMSSLQPGRRKKKNKQKAKPTKKV